MEAAGPERIRFTREQFYEKLWSIPTTRIAKELGCSDVMIGKICKAFDIPKPYLGYWAKLEHGKVPKKTPLPTRSDPEDKVLTFKKWPDRELTDAKPNQELEYDADIREMLDKARSLPPVRVLESLSSPHSLVVATRSLIRFYRALYPKRSPSDQRPSGPTVSIEVSEGRTTRALCIIDALIKRVEKIGGTIEVKKGRWQKWKANTVVCFGGEDVAVIRLREKYRRVRVQPDKKKYSFESDTTLEPSGMLILDNGPSISNCTLLADTPKHHKIENGLNDLIIGFVKKAGELRIQRRKKEAARIRMENQERVRRQQEDELRKQREELASQQQAEQTRVDQLMSHADSWQHSRLIREYLGALCDMLLERNGAIDIQSEAAEYLRWAYQQADRIDPLKPSPTSVLDQEIE